MFIMLIHAVSILFVLVIVVAKPSVGSVQTKCVTPTSLSSSPAILNLNSTLQACIEGNSGKHRLEIGSSSDVNNL